MHAMLNDTSLARVPVRPRAYPWSRNHSAPVRVTLPQSLYWLVASVGRQVAMGSLTGAVAVGVGTASRWRNRTRRNDLEAKRLRRELEAERYAARHDPLTGLPNRRAFHELSKPIVATAWRTPLVCVVVDLDGFKTINDSLGHAAGDEVLVTVARRLDAQAGARLVARIGGDEFAGIFCVSGTGQTICEMAARLADALSAPVRAAGCTVGVHASVGLASVDGSLELAEVLKRADRAMYQAKRAPAPDSGGTDLDLARCHRGALILRRRPWSPQALGAPVDLEMAPQIGSKMPRSVA